MKIHFRAISIHYNNDIVIQSSFIQTVTVGFGITPNHALRLVGFTTGRDLHPALKILFNYLKVTRKQSPCQDKSKLQKVPDHDVT